jgi:hypothetical protein
LYARKREGGEANTIEPRCSRCSGPAKVEGQDKCERVQVRSARWDAAAETTADAE